MSRRISGSLALLAAVVLSGSGPVGPAGGTGPDPCAPQAVQTDTTRNTPDARSTDPRSADEKRPKETDPQARSATIAGCSPVPPRCPDRAAVAHAREVPLGLAFVPRGLEEWRMRNCPRGESGE